MKHFDLQRISRLILALVFFLISFCATSQAANEGPPILISDNGTAGIGARMDQQNPRVAALPDLGLWFVVWEDWRTAADAVGSNSGADIWGQFVDANGTLCGDPILISDEDNDGTGDPGNQSVPSVAYDQGDGRLLVVWQDTRAADTNSTRPGPEEGYIYARGIEVSGCTAGDLTLLQEQPISYTPAFTGSELLSRKGPRVTYDDTRDQFWIAWVESRSSRKHVEFFAFGCPDPASYYGWTVGDTSFPAFAALKSTSSDPLPEEVAPDLVRTGGSQNIRLLERQIGCTTDVITYEFFDDVNNIDIDVDPSSGDVFLVWEGVQQTLTVTNTSDEPQGSPNKCYDCLVPVCVSVGDNELLPIFDSSLNIVECCDGNVTGNVCTGVSIPPYPWTDTFTSASSITAEHEDMVHIYGIHKKEISLPVVTSKLISSPTSLAYMPSVKADPITGRFLVAWEDLRDGPLFTKIYGQLVYSGGGLYNTNFIIGFQDLNNDGLQDEVLKDARQTSPYVGYDHLNQRFFVAWQDGRNGSLSIENLDIYGQYVDAEGSLRGGNYLVSASSNGQPAEGNQYSPAIAFNLFNHMFLSVWKDARNFETTNSDIFGQRFSIGQPQLAVLNPDDTVMSPALIDFGSRITNEEDVSVSFKLRNTGDVDLNLQNISSLSTPFSFEGLPAELTDNDGVGVILPPSGEIAVTVTFAPTEVGSFQQKIVITSDAGEATIRLQGIGIEQPTTVSSVSVNPSNISFGSVALGSASYQNLTLKNDGNSAVNLVTIENPEAPFTVLGGPQTGSIEPGTSLTFSIKFAPGAEGTFVSRLVYIFTETSPVIVEIKGTGSTTVNPPHIFFSKGFVDFGDVEVNKTKSFNLKVTNDGGQDTQILSIDSPREGFTVSNISAGQVIGRGESTNILVQFTPAEAREYEETLEILFTHQGSPSIITLRGTGLETPAGDPDVSCSAEAVNFGNVDIGRTRYERVLCTNNGESTAKILAAQIFGKDKDAFSIPTYTEITTGVELDRGESKVLWLGFVPDKNKSYEAELELLLDYKSEPVRIALSGRGVPEGMGMPSLQYYLFSDIPPQFSGQSGQSQLYVVELKGEEVRVELLREPSSPYILEKVLEKQPQPAAPLFGTSSADGHYIYSVVLGQQVKDGRHGSQLTAIGSGFTTLHSSSFFSVLVPPANWQGIENPMLDVELNGHKAVYLTANQALQPVHMTISTQWLRAPSGTAKGDFYLILTNQDLSRIYCFDLLGNRFSLCPSTSPVVSDVAVGVTLHDYGMDFVMPESTSGLWRIYWALVTDSGALFYDQAALIIDDTNNGELIEVY